MDARQLNSDMQRRMCTAMLQKVMFKSMLVVMMLSCDALPSALISLLLWILCSCADLSWHLPVWGCLHSWLQ